MGLSPATILLAALAFSGTAAHAFSGTLRSSTDVYPQALGKPTKEITPYLILDANGKNKLSKKLRIQYRLYGLTNPESEHAPEKLYGDIPEAFAEFKATSAFRMRLGMNTVNWGVTDISSPADVVNPSAFLHPLRILKRGSPMLELDFDKEVFGVHAIYIPRQRRSLLPSADSRWLPRNLLVNVAYAGSRIEVPKFMEYEYDKDEVMSHALDHNAGLRLTSHLGSLDLFAMHFEGAAPQPKVRPSITLVPSGPNFAAVSPVRLAPIFYRVRTTSAGLVWAREKWIFRAESAYQHTISEDPLLQPGMWSNVLATETTLDIGTTSMILLAQLYYTKNPQAPDNLISSSYRLFDQTALLGTRWAWSEQLTLTASILFEAKTKGTFAMIGFENKLSDALRWGLGWRDFAAPEEGLLKTYDRNDHATLDLTYYF